VINEVNAVWSKSPMLVDINALLFGATSFKSAVIVSQIDDKPSDTSGGGSSGLEADEQAESSMAMPKLPAITAKLVNL
jgi:hypothetical protein